jgi:hypothetical protein
MWSLFPSDNTSFPVIINQSFASFPGLRIPYFHGIHTQGADSGVIEQAILFSTPKSIIMKSKRARTGVKSMKAIRKKVSYKKTAGAIEKKMAEIKLASGSAPVINMHSPLFRYCY